MPQMGYDTKTDRLTDCQSQCDSDSDCSSSFVACVFISAGICLLSRCLEMNVYSGSAIPAFRHHVTV
jgi:hypothetical protein